MAHPIRPESYIAMDNFYTATVYSKGAEVSTLVCQSSAEGASTVFSSHILHSFSWWGAGWNWWGRIREFLFHPSCANFHPRVHSDPFYSNRHPF